MNISAPGGATPEKPLWEQNASDEGERLQKVLARVGYGSRRVCEEIIQDGRVTVNGVVAILGKRVLIDTDTVEVDGVTLGVRPGLVYYLLNKPTGVVSTAFDTHDRQTILELVPAEPRVFSIGRLDMETEGLIILTNDGDLGNVIAHPSSAVEKEYVAEVQCGPQGVSQSAIRRLRVGIELEDGITAPAEVGQPENGVLRITIHEGKNRQIRRMCEEVGYPVQRLVRVRIGPIRDQHLSPGEWRHLTHAELRLLREAVAMGKAGGRRQPPRIR